MFPKIDFLGTPTDTYALCGLISIIILPMVVLLFRPKEFPAKFVFWGVIIVIIFAFIGAVLFNIILYGPQYLAEYKEGESIIKVLESVGFAYLGIPILGFFALWVYCRWIGVPFLVIADYVAPFFMLERVIGRLGCLGYGCCYGIPSSLPWAYPFKSWGIAEIVPRHPTQAYELIFVLAIFVSSSYLYKRTKGSRGVSDTESSKNKSVDELKQILRKAPSAGIIFFYVWLCYGFLRFWNEFLRAEGSFIYGPVKISHVILLGFVTVSMIGLFIIIKNSTAKNEILNALKSAVIRLLMWFLVSSVVFLSAISLYLAIIGDASL